MSIIFRYVHIQRQDKTLRKAPYIPIFAITDSGKMIKIAALIDSGADFTVVPKDLATILGLKEETLTTETAGIGGKVPVKKSRLNFRIIGRREEYPLNIPVLVLQEENSDVPLLLGRNGFFESFHITFQQNKEKIILNTNIPSVFN